MKLIPQNNQDGPVYFFTTSDGEEHCNESDCLAAMLYDDVLFANCFPFKYRKEDDELQEPTVVLFVNCNDVFSWGTADAENLPYDEIGNLFEMWRTDPKHGSTRWCCIKRNEQPQEPLKEMMIKDGAWDDVLEALPKNKYQIYLEECKKQGTGPYKSFLGIAKRD